MNNYLLSILSMIFILILSSCSTSWRTGAESREGYGWSDPIDELWLLSNEEIVIEELFNFLGTQHPSTAIWFPNLRIEKTSLSGYELYTAKNQSLVKTIERIINSVSSRLVQNSNDRVTWTIEAEIHFLEPDKTSFEEESFVTEGGYVLYGFLCWQTALIVCPFSGDASIVVIKGNVSTNKGEIINLTSYGGSSALITSPWLGDSPQHERDLQSKAHAKALVASIASFAENLVREIETRRPL